MGKELIFVKDVFGAGTYYKFFNFWQFHFFRILKY